MYSFNRLYNIVISAVCMGIAQHAFGLGWFAWFCLVPFFLSIKEYANLKKLCLDVSIWAFIYHLISLYWLSENIGVDERYIAFITMLLTNLICSLNIILIFILFCGSRTNKMGSFYSKQSSFHRVKQWHHLAL